MTAIERVIARARAEVGYIEKYSRQNLDDKTANAGEGNNTKYARDLDALGIYNGKKQGYDWCDVFADWCFIMEFGEELGLEMICQPEKSYGAGVNSSAGYYKAEGRLDKKPAVGDQVYFIGSDGLYYHTGLVAAVDADTITTIEGNAGYNSTRVVETVYKRSDKKLGAFGHPKWHLAEKAPEKPKTEAKPDAEKDKAEFAEATSVKLGDVVRMKKGALVYGKDYEFASWVYSRDLYVRGISGKKITVSTLKEGAVTGNVDIKYLTKNGESVKADESAKQDNILKVGDKVKVKAEAPVYGKSYGFAAFVYKTHLYVRQIDGNRVVISTQKNGAVTGAIDKKHLIKVN